MKRALLTVTAATIIAASIQVYGASGDVAGNIYYTDIQTYIYHSPVTSYNIGGKTVIDAEILNWHYGFDVYWYDDTRRLEITDKGGEFNSLQAMSGELVESNDGIVGDISGQYYETDIVTTLNGEEIEAYNIGGRTMIVAEAMRDFGYTVDWDEGRRTLTISKPADFYKIETDYGTVMSMYPETTVNEYAAYSDSYLTIEDDDGKIRGYMPLKDGTKLYSASSISYVKLSELAEIFGAECHFDAGIFNGHSSWVNGVEYDTLEYVYTLHFNFDKSNKPQFIDQEPQERTHEFVTFDSAYRLSPAFYVNGSEADMWQIKGARGEHTFHLLVLDGEIYVPTFSLKNIFGYAYIY